MNNHLDILREQARALPESPGVYFWHDGDGEVLYIGKAVNLRSRVGSYFSNMHHDRRTRDLVMRARSIQCEIASTELEALFRESAMIKQLQPPFNRLLRTSRRAFFLKFDRSRPDPFMEVARSTEDPDALYFGPFRTGRMLRETMEFVHAVLPLRKCAAAAPRCRPCLYNQMHTCAAPALDEEHRQRHEEAIRQLFELLDGRTDRVTGWLEGKRDRLAENLMFELAAKVQERIDTVRDIEKQHAILEAAVRCRCVLVHQRDPARGSEKLLLVAHGQVLSVRDGSTAEPDGIVRWVQAHASLVQAVVRRQSEMDAASVLERWIVTKRDNVRWVAIPPDAGEDDVRDRVEYVLAVPARVPAGAASSV